MQPQPQMGVQEQFPPQRGRAGACSGGQSGEPAVRHSPQTLRGVNFSHLQRNSAFPSCSFPQVSVQKSRGPLPAPMLPRPETRPGPLSAQAPAPPQPPAEAENCSTFPTPTDVGTVTGGKAEKTRSWLVGSMRHTAGRATRPREVPSPSERQTNHHSAHPTPLSSQRHPTPR